MSLVPNVLIDGLVIATVASSINISLALLYAKKENYKVDSNQELLACVSKIFLQNFNVTNRFKSLIIFNLHVELMPHSFHNYWKNKNEAEV